MDSWKSDLDASFSIINDVNDGEKEGDGWLMTYPVYYWFSESGWSCGGVLGDLYGNGKNKERSGETWKVDYLCVRRDMEKKEQTEVARKLFTTHLYRLVFPDFTARGGKGAIRGYRNSALFRGNPLEESMCKVLPIVKFQIVEVELAEKEVWPLSKRWNMSRRRWVKMGVGGNRENGLNATVIENRLWRNWLEGWYLNGGGGSNGGAIGGFKMVGVMTYAMWLDKLKTGDWYVWVLFRPFSRGESGIGGDSNELGGEEIEAVLCFRNERCLVERQNEIRGMAGSGTEIFTLVGSWFKRGVSVEEGRDIFRSGLREMRRVRKTFRILRVEVLGYNIGLMNSLRVSGGGQGGNELKIGYIVKRDWMAYYFYNRFWGEIDARNCFMLL